MWSYTHAPLRRYLLPYSLCEHLDRLVPSRAFVARNLGAPAEPVGLQVAEDPAQQGAVAAFAFLEDLFAAQPADELGAIAGAGIDPRYPVGVELRVVDAKRHAVLVVERPPALRLADVGTLARRRDPHVLDGAAFEHALEANLPVVAPRAGIGRERLLLGFPAADQLVVEMRVVEMHAPELRGAPRAALSESCGFAGRGHGAAARRA